MFGFESSKQYNVWRKYHLPPSLLHKRTDRGFLYSCPRYAGRQCAWQQHSHRYIFWSACFLPFCFVFLSPFSLFVFSAESIQPYSTHTGTFQIFTGLAVCVGILAANEGVIRDNSYFYQVSSESFQNWQIQELTNCVWCRNRFWDLPFCVSGEPQRCAFSYLRPCLRMSGQK